jgi:hypothetical protein
LINTLQVDCEPVIFERLDRL